MLLRPPLREGPVRGPELNNQCLRHTANRNGKTLHVVTEEYTSRTCTHCLCVQKRFSAKVFKCPFCSYGPVGRDSKATQCIMLMHMQLPAGGGSGSGSSSGSGSGGSSSSNSSGRRRNPNPNPNPGVGRRMGRWIDGSYILGAQLDAIERGERDNDDQ